MAVSNFSRQRVVNSIHHRELATCPVLGRLPWLKPTANTDSWSPLLRMGLTSIIALIANWQHQLDVRWQPIRYFLRKKLRPICLPCSPFMKGNKFYGRLGDKPATSFTMFARILIHQTQHSHWQSDIHPLSFPDNLSISALTKVQKPSASCDKIN